MSEARYELPGGIKQKIRLFDDHFDIISTNKVLTLLARQVENGPKNAGDEDWADMDFNYFDVTSLQTSNVSFVITLGARKIKFEFPAFRKDNDLIKEAGEFFKRKVRESKSGSNSSGGSSFSPADELIKYKTLLDQGIITDREFSEKKYELLGIRPKENAASSPDEPIKVDEQSEHEAASEPETMTDRKFPDKKANSPEIEPEESSTSFPSESVDVDEQPGSDADLNKADSKESPDVCPHCGELLEGDYVFCPNCGCELSKAAETAAVHSEIPAADDFETYDADIYRDLQNCNYKNDTAFDYWVFKVENMEIGADLYFRMFLFNRKQNGGKLNSLSLQEQDGTVKTLTPKEKSEGIYECTFMGDSSFNISSMTVKNAEQRNSGRTVSYKFNSDGRLLKAMEAKYGKIRISPLVESDYWQCTCGRIHNSDDSDCLCGNSRAHCEEMLSDDYDSFIIREYLNEGIKLDGSLPFNENIENYISEFSRQYPDIPVRKIKEKINVFEELEKYNAMKGDE